MYKASHRKQRGKTAPNRALIKKPCIYCDIKSPECEIFIEPLTKDWYLEFRTDEWDREYNDWVYERIYYIQYCPYCGRKLGGK